MKRAEGTPDVSPTQRPPVVLCIGGTDPLCGAGIVADALHVAELGGWPLAVETASVQQDSRHVGAVAAHNAEDVAARVHLALVDARPDAVKVGMLADPATADTILRVLTDAGYTGPVVVDPVLASGGSSSTQLAARGLAGALLSWSSLPHVLVTPNLSEAVRLAAACARATEWSTSDDALADAAALEKIMGMPVLLKGGHRDPPGLDVLSNLGRCTLFHSSAAWPHDVHGTGCALATAIATSAARGATWQDAVSAAKRWIDAIALDPARVRQVGRGRHQFVPRVWR